MINQRNAGFFVYIDLSQYLPKDDSLSGQEQEFALAQKLLDNGLFLHPGEEHCKDLGWFRLVYSHDEDFLREGLRRYVSLSFFLTLGFDLIIPDRLIKTVKSL